MNPDGLINNRYFSLRILEGEKEEHLALYISGPATRESRIVEILPASWRKRKTKRAARQLGEIAVKLGESSTFDYEFYQAPSVRFPFREEIDGETYTVVNPAMRSKYAGLSLDKEMLKGAEEQLKHKDRA